MKKRIFICPLGMSDPVRDNQDGPLLQIIRNYEPDKIYLIMTRDVAEYDKDYDVYTKHIDYVYKNSLKKECEEIGRAHV